MGAGNRGSILMMIASLGLGLMAIPAVSDDATQTAAVKSRVIISAAAFNHNRAEHRAPCLQCHQRADNNPVPAFPGHQTCINCHVGDFVSRESRLCATCHTMPVTPDARKSTFPSRLAQFGLKEFSHKVHQDQTKMPGGATVPKCESCHRFDSTAIEAGFPDHPQCYSCHAHEAGQKQGTCEACHGLPNSSLLYAKSPGLPFTEYKFVHSKHLEAPGIKGDCSKCHAMFVTQQPGVSDITRIQTIKDKKPHNSDCWQSGCHQTKKENTCTKCHVHPPAVLTFG